MPYQEKIQMLVDGHNGVHIPELFVRWYFPKNWGIPEQDTEILLLGHSHPLYWDTWERVLNNAKGNNKDSHTWTLHQDGDLWAVRDDMTEADWAEWGV